MYPHNYKPIKGDWSLIVLHIAVESHGGKLIGFPLIHCAPWAHINKDRCNVSRFVLELQPEHVKTQELHVCPLIEEDTHHCKFTTVSHTDFMVVQLNELKRKNAHAALRPLEPIVIEDPIEQDNQGASPMASPTPEAVTTDISGADAGADAAPSPDKEGAASKARRAAHRRRRLAAPPSFVDFDTFQEAENNKRKREHTLSGAISRRRSKSEERVAKLAKNPQLTYAASDTAAANM